ncbi:MAG: SDR family oxidoreductase [Alphaproteobacteria bacterium]|nr:SDR family oxidoreductase [Alphaproteobacteria bacterium]
MPSILITGANGGLGVELTRQYSADGWRVLAAVRDPARASDLDPIVRASGGGVTLHRLDVNDRAQITALAKDLASESIDVLLNNAGLMESWDYTFGRIDYALWERILRTNLIAPVNVANAFLAHVARSERKLVVTLSSGLGSMTDNTWGKRLSPGRLYMYRSSKAAMNMATKCLSFDLKPRGVAAVVITPGHVRTRMGGPGAPLAAEESITNVRKVIAGLTLKDSGKFFFYTGSEYPW